MSDDENGPGHRRRRKGHDTLPEKGPSKTEEPQEEVYAFRNGLRTWGIHKDWPDLPLHFRKYRLLLEYFELHKPENVPEDDLKTLSFIIEQMLDNLAKSMEGTIESISGEVISNVRWAGRFEKKPAKWGLDYTPEPIANVRGRIMQMRPKSSYNAPYRKSINYRFSLYLRDLEGLLTVGPEHGGEKIGIVNPFGVSADIVGWALEAPTGGGAAPEISDEETHEDPSEARLGVTGCDFDEVKKEHVERGGTFRGIARLISWFGDEPDQKSIHGTGWLVDKKTIATAGHCVYNKNLGFLKSVEVTFGNESGDPTVRHGTQAVVHWCYYTIFAGKSDLGFIRLDRSIGESNAKRLPYIQTPRVSPDGGMRLIARGYPKVSEQPARMRSSECVANYNLAQTGHYLEYELDTEKGSSGCPVFNATNEVIGIHVRTGATRRRKGINKGVIIDKKDNNPAAFLAFLDHLGSQRMRALSGRFQRVSAGVTRYTA